MTRARRRLLAAGLACAAATLLVGCAAGSASEVTVLRADGLVALVDPSGDDGMDAQVVGVIALTGGGCLAIDDGSGAGAVPLIWPPGTTLDGDEVVLASGERLVVGDEVSGAGGEIPAADAGDLPGECEPVDGMILLVHEMGRS